MPSIVHPDLPEDVERAVDMFGNRVRVAVIRSLLTRGPATRADLADRLGVSPSLLQKHLATLEQLAAVDLTPPRTVPGVRPRMYGTDPHRIAAAVEALSRGLGV